MISTNDFRTGLTIELEEMHTLFCMNRKGGRFCPVKAENRRTGVYEDLPGKVFWPTWRKKMNIYRRQQLCFMDTDNYEQISHLPNS